MEDVEQDVILDPPSVTLIRTKYVGMTLIGYPIRGETVLCIETSRKAHKDSD